MYLFNCSPYFYEDDVNVVLNRYRVPTRYFAWSQSINRKIKNLSTPWLIFDKEKVKNWNKKSTTFRKCSLFLSFDRDLSLFRPWDRLRERERDRFDRLWRGRDRDRDRFPCRDRDRERDDRRRRSFERLRRGERDFDLESERDVRRRREFGDLSKLRTLSGPLLPAPLVSTPNGMAARAEAAASWR